MTPNKARTRISTGNRYERSVGYSRAIRFGDHVYVGGTTALTTDGDIVGVDDPYQQTKQVLATIQWALEQAGATLEDTVRYRIYLRDIGDIASVSPALYETFGEIQPVNTLIGGIELADPRMLVEIEAEAIVGSAQIEEG